MPRLGGAVLAACLTGLATSVRAQSPPPVNSGPLVACYALAYSNPVGADSTGWPDRVSLFANHSVVTHTSGPDSVQMLRGFRGEFWRWNPDSLRLDSARLKSRIGGKWWTWQHGSLVLSFSNDFSSAAFSLSASGDSVFGILKYFFDGDAFMLDHHVAVRGVSVRC